MGKVIDYANNPKKTRNPKYNEQEYQALADVLTYAKDEEKTEKQFFVEGINCNPSTARDQFITTKEYFGKTDGVQAYHGYMSFKEQDITPELAQQVGMEFAKRMWGNRFQVVVTCHLNTHHLHCHFVINSVSFVDGKGWSITKNDGTIFATLQTRYVKNMDCISILNQNLSVPPITTTINWKKQVCPIDTR